MGSGFLNTGANAGNTAEKNKGGKVVVCDLDGTLLKGNSLKWLLAIGMKRLLVRGRIFSMARIALLGALSKVHLVTHEKMKYTAIRLFGNDHKVYDKLIKKARMGRNPEVETVLKRHQERGEWILLATAASENYVPMIWNGLYIASPFGGPDLKGERKLKAVKTWLKARNMSISIFMTDHHNDLPLAEWAYRHGAKIILVNSSHETQRQFYRNAIYFKRL